MRIDLNCDLGEFPLDDIRCVDTKIMPYISSANIACGGHAGDEVSMNNAILQAQNNGVFIGAHPSYPDREGFGRRSMNLPLDELKGSIQGQVYQLKKLTERAGAELVHVKPHGALYRDASLNEEVAGVLIEAVREIDDQLILVGQCSSKLVRLCRTRGVPARCEGFADRAYESSGLLRARNLPGAVLGDHLEMGIRTVEMIRAQRVRTVSGKFIPIEAESVCIHGDHPGAIEFAKTLFEHLRNKGIEVIKTKKIKR